MTEQNVRTCTLFLQLLKYQNVSVNFYTLTYDPHDLHGGLPAANVGHPLGEGPLVDEAELEGVAAHLNQVVEEGAEAGQWVGRAEQGHVTKLNTRLNSDAWPTDG